MRKTLPRTIYKENPSLFNHAADVSDIHKRNIYALQEHVNGRTYSDIAKELDRSKERIRQLCLKAVGVLLTKERLMEYRRRYWGEETSP